jgi:hypothetical protein
MIGGAHMTDPDARGSATFPGQASWGLPETGKHCGDCAHWGCGGKRERGAARVWANIAA